MVGIVLKCCYYKTTQYNIVTEVRISASIQTFQPITDRYQSIKTTKFKCIFYLKNVCRSKYAVLNNRHAYFLLVDNGTSGRYGAEVLLRRKLEKFIAAQKLHSCKYFLPCNLFKTNNDCKLLLFILSDTHSSTPMVCLVIEGGTHTIRAVLEYVTDTPPVPVVVCDGSGRAADLIAFVHK